MRGEMLWFNERKNHGFILTEEGERLSVLGEGFADGVPAGRCAQAMVTFDVSEESGTRQATNVVFEPAVAARRARRRGGRGAGP
jgi:hypothetical protein